MNKKNILLAALVLVSFQVIYYFVVFWTWGPKDHGLFGDMFGGLNSLFSGLAFLALVATLYMQSQELALQRNELRLQREELKQNREALDRQRDQMEKSQQALSTQAGILADSSVLEAVGSMARAGQGLHLSNELQQKLDAVAPLIVARLLEHSQGST